MEHELPYLRICPQCRYENPEHEYQCQQCGLFIGMEPAILANPVIGDPITPTIHEQQPPAINSEPLTDWSWNAAHLPQIADDASPDTIELECLGYPLVLTVPKGATIGQQHHQQGADIPIPSEIAESRYLHRRHCRIDKENGRWWLTAIEQSVFGRDFTNPTRINDLSLAPGERQELHEGDLLRLSGLRMRVRRVT